MRYYVRESDTVLNLGEDIVVKACSMFKKCCCNYVKKRLER